MLQRRCNRTASRHGRATGGSSLATTRSLPKLQELCFGGGPVRTDPAWDRVLGASFPIYLHGTQVSAEYPKRC